MRNPIGRVLVLVGFLASCLVLSGAQTNETIVVDPAAAAHPFPHFWEEMFGSGRAILTLRENYRRDMHEVKQITDFHFVRFHAILQDDLAVYSEDEKGQVAYNFSYVDQIYDGLLAQGVRPFVELSFMPKALAAKDIPFGFWDHPNVSPPKEYAKWDDLITQFTKHLIEHYGIDEVSQWYFEVWNEPNIDFWGGNPKQPTYWELYDHTAKALKAVSPKLRVGGPSTAQAAWADVFIQHCVENKIPVDFVSTHVYGNDKSEDVFGTHEVIPRDQMVCKAVKKVHDQIKASSMPNLPLIWSEFNASYMNEPNVTDRPYMGPWLADTLRQCDGLVDLMSYWTFSDVFDEGGPVKTPFYGGFGLIANGGIPKPAFNAFRVLHLLGEERLALDSNSALLTRKKDGSLVVAMWNYAPPEKEGAAKTVTLKFKGASPSQATISVVDPQHGDVHAAYESMGSPKYPTAAQQSQLRKAAELAAPETRQLSNGELTLTLPSYALAVITVK